ncbi:DUF6230 family protein [Halocatena pleomorpha]|uniref:Uncharacterized protein n=1 Tax=Halocatena pleomorpha TaxID=1785090 RepID=A0A3P3R721_9EURY|nr:DUF6230 family protein [Halocatena pleomorpha]RRJ29155.1 hypothetical protein EIK79_13530 [Halocatena pleomorpha]
MYNKRTFGKGMGASIGLLAVIALLIISTGSAYAVPLAGIGGFTIQADQLTAESAYIYPGVDDTSNQDAYPMAVIEQKDVKIDGMKLMKSLDVSAVPGLSGSARVVMTSSDTVTADQQMVKVSNIEADTAEFNQQVIDESNSNNPSDQFGIWAGDASKNQDKLQDGKIVDISGDGPAQKLQGANIKAHYLASSSISIPGLSLQVQYDQDGDGQYNE